MVLGPIFLVMFSVTFEWLHISSWLHIFWLKATFWVGLATGRGDGNVAGGDDAGRGGSPATLVGYQVGRGGAGRPLLVLPAPPARAHLLLARRGVVIGQVQPVIRAWHVRPGSPGQEVVLILSREAAIIHWSCVSGCIWWIGFEPRSAETRVGVDVNCFTVNHGFTTFGSLWLVQVLKVVKGFKLIYCVGILDVIMPFDRLTVLKCFFMECEEFFVCFSTRHLKIFRHYDGFVVIMVSDGHKEESSLTLWVLRVQRQRLVAAGRVHVLTAQVAGTVRNLFVNRLAFRGGLQEEGSQVNLKQIMSWSFVKIFQALIVIV